MTPVVLALVAAAGWAQVEVTSIVSDSSALESTADVTVSRFADFSEEPGIEIGTQLDVGDMLSSISGATDVELTCGDSTQLRFAGGFRVLIDESEEGTDCAINFLSGTLDVITDQPTEVDTGTVILGSEGTQYTVELVREGGEADRRLLVFDGRVRVNALGAEQRVETGATWRLAGGEARWGEVDAADLDRTPKRYAIFDACKSLGVLTPAEKEAAIAEFSRLHYEVLSRPDDAQKRAALAKKQLEKASSPQALYHLKRGDITTTDQFERYEIDPAVLQDMGRYLATAGGALRPIGQLERAAADPFELIEQKRYEDAIELLTAQARSSADSRTWFGLTIAWFELDGIRSRKAYDYSRRALEAHKRDRKLTSVEIARCRKIRDAHRLWHR